MIRSLRSYTPVGLTITPPGFMHVRDMCNMLSQLREQLNTRHELSRRAIRRQGGAHGSTRQMRTWEAGAASERPGCFSLAGAHDAHIASALVLEFRSHAYSQRNAVGGRTCVLKAVAFLGVWVPLVSSYAEPSENIVLILQPHPKLDMRTSISPLLERMILVDVNVGVQKSRNMGRWLDPVRRL